MASNDGAAVRVLFVDYSIGFGGATKSLGLVLRALPDVQATVLTTQRAEERMRWYGHLKTHRFRHLVNYESLQRLREHIGTGLWGSVAWKFVSALALAATWWNAGRLWWLLRRKPFDLVHLNNGLVPREALWVTRTTGTPCVVHMRGFPSVEDVAALSGHVRRIVCVSRSVADVVRAGGYADERIDVIWDPVDIAAFDTTRDVRAATRQRHGIDDADVVVGLFGRVVRWKGTLEFVQACLIALARGERIRPLIVGDASDGPAAYVAEVQAAVRASPFADRFVFAGYQPEPEAYYHAADIVVHASVEPEPFGMVVPEGMIAGKAIIAMAQGGPLDVIEHGVDGLLAPPKDVEALAAAITQLASDPARRSDLGTRASAKARERFTVSGAAARLRETWHRALA